jgi:xanthine dehydrogenase accessory factor
MRGTRAGGNVVTHSERVLRELLNALDQRRPVAMVTVVLAEGSLAGTLGRRAVIWELGQHVEVRGDLGLGTLEAQARDAAWKVLETRRSKLIDVEGESGRAQLFVEVQHRPPTLLIVGAGHIALPLAKLGKMCDFDVVVFDDRASFASKERFPMADQVIAAPFEAALRDFPMDEDTYIVLVTRGHQHDVSSLLEALHRPAAYIGMIGSQRRVRAVFQLLEEKGIPRERFERVHSPIGLDIGSETPAEIAVSIMAEIVKVRRGGTGLPLSDERRQGKKKR